MSTTSAPQAPPARVRERARDALGVMALSVVCSGATAAGLLLLTHVLPRLAR